MTQPSIFISYAHEDKTLARVFADALEAEGLRVWIDANELLAGDSIIEQVSRAVADVDFFCALVSTASRGSRWCQQELHFAMTHWLASDHSIIIPVRVGNVEMPPSISDKLYIELDPADVKLTASRIAGDVRRHRARRESSLPQPAPHPEPPHSALDPPRSSTIRSSGVNPLAIPPEDAIPEESGATSTGPIDPLSGIRAPWRRRAEAAARSTRDARLDALADAASEEQAIGGSPSAAVLAMQLVSRLRELDYGQGLSLWSGTELIVQLSKNSGALVLETQYLSPSVRALAHAREAGMQELTEEAIRLGAGATTGGLTITPHLCKPLPKSRAELEAARQAANESQEAAEAAHRASEIARVRDERAFERMAQGIVAALAPDIEGRVVTLADPWPFATVSRNAGVAVIESRAVVRRVALDDPSPTDKVAAALRDVVGDPSQVRLHDRVLLTDSVRRDLPKLLLALTSSDEPTSIALIRHEPHQREVLRVRRDRAGSMLVLENPGRDVSFQTFSRADLAEVQRRLEMKIDAESARLEPGDVLELVAEFMLPLDAARVPPASPGE